MFDDLPGGGAAGNPEPSPGSTGTGVSPSPGQGAAAGSPPAGAVSWSTPGVPEQLRNEYQTTKTNLDAWAKLGNRDEVARNHQTFGKLSQEALSLGQKLGYDVAEIQQTFASDPVGTIAVLRQMAQQAASSSRPPTQQEIQQLIQRGIQQGLQPFQVEREQRLDAEAETRFDQAFDGHFKTSFPNGLPDSAKEALSGLAWALLTENGDGYNALRSQADVSHVAAAFDQAKKTLLKIITDYGDFEKKRIAGGEAGAPPPAAHKPKLQTIDDVLARISDRSIPTDQIFAGR